jgi:hypothetical protein
MSVSDFKHAELWDLLDEANAEMIKLKAKVAELESSVRKHREHVGILTIHMAEIQVLDKTENTLNGVIGHCLESINDWSDKWAKLEAGEL